MRGANISTAAILITLIVLASFIALNIDSNTTPDDFTAITSSDIDIGFGWPLVCVIGTISTERHFYATGFLALWESTTSPRIAWLGLAGNTLVALLLVTRVYWTACSVQAKLKLRTTIATMVGATAFVGLVLIARLQTWNDLAEIDPEIPKRQMVAELFQYAELIVWAAVFVTCLMLPVYATSAFKSLREASQRLGRKEPAGE